MATSFTVNGKPTSTDAPPATPLLWVIREGLKLTGTKFGCGAGLCGACMVHIDGQPVRSCTTPLSTATRGPITTIEGLGSPEKPHPVQQAFIGEQAAQCGYCINGMIMAAAALIAKNKRPSRMQIRSALNGNLCRCGTHMRIIRAVEHAADLSVTQSGADNDAAHHGRGGDD